uniref:C2 tensin-type domain-containing protein n=1 Tax=Ascaris lumbricoides TaxID=6252 RepID=A0A0M3IS15_ASCLU
MFNIGRMFDGQILDVELESGERTFEKAARTIVQPKSTSEVQSSVPAQLENETSDLITRHQPRRSPYLMGAINSQRHYYPNSDLEEEVETINDDADNERTSEVTIMLGDKKAVTNFCTQPTLVLQLHKCSISDPDVEARIYFLV